MLFNTGIILDFCTHLSFLLGQMDMHATGVATLFLLRLLRHAHTFVSFCTPPWSHLTMPWANTNKLAHDLGDTPCPPRLHRHHRLRRPDSTSGRGGRAAAGLDDRREVKAHRKQSKQQRRSRASAAGRRRRRDCGRAEGPREARRALSDRSESGTMCVSARIAVTNGGGCWRG